MTISNDSFRHSVLRHTLMLFSGALSLLLAGGGQATPIGNSNVEIQWWEDLDEYVRISAWTSSTNPSADDDIYDEIGVKASTVTVPWATYNDPSFDDLGFPSKTFYEKFFVVPCEVGGYSIYGRHRMHYIAGGYNEWGPTFDSTFISVCED